MDFQTERDLHDFIVLILRFTAEIFSKRHSDCQHDLANEWQSQEWSSSLLSSTWYSFYYPTTFICELRAILERRNGYTLSKQFRITF